MVKHGFGDGSKLYEQRAREALPLLVAQAKAGNTIQYGQLAQELGMPNARNLNHVLGAIGRELRNLSREWREPIPPINCLVINKQRRTPGRGIQFHMPITHFESLSRAAQQKELDRLDSVIWDYKNWDKVLKHFGMRPVVPAEIRGVPELARVARSGGAGETPEHRRFKRFIRSHPSVLGLTHTVAAELEYAFLSADKVDVLFKGRQRWIGVEVKAAHSGEGDLLRGIFQTAKYQALLEASQRFEHLRVDAQAILAMEGTLSPRLRRIANNLKVQVFEAIPVPRSFEPLRKSALRGP
jgi:hypothetical protein